MPYEFKHQRRVEFYETDMAGIMHFSNYFRYMEAAEHAFFRSLGLSLHEEATGRMQGWARVRAECRYLAPLRYQDLVEIHLIVTERGGKSLTYAFIFTRVGENGDPAAAREVARGAVTAVFVAREVGNEEMRAMPMPDTVAGAVEPAPAPLLETHGIAL